MPIVWRFDRPSVPKGLAKGKVKKKIAKAFEAWTEPITPCDLPEGTGYRFKFQGVTKRNPKADSVNTVDFGRLDSSAIALTYTYFLNNEVVEFDIRLNKKHQKWAASKKNKRRFQIGNAVTHELGHALSLNDLPDANSKLTMFGAIHKGETRKETLGRGDVLGAKATAP